jgi:hypothetical protein
LQKRAEAQETRKADIHPYKLKTAQANAERAQASAAIRAIAAADKIAKALPPGSRQIAA